MSTARKLYLPVLQRKGADQTRTESSYERGQIGGNVTAILARINRVELGEFDALVLGLFLMSHYQGQLVVPDFGFYGRDIHTRLIRENRLIAGVNHLEELPAKLRQSVLLIIDKVPGGATSEDAQTLARYAQLLPGTNEFNDFVGAAIARPTV